MKHTEEATHTISRLLDDLRQGKYGQADAGAFPAEFAGIVAAINALSANMAELQDYTVSLADGDLDADPPGRQNYLASATKRLHAQLNHISWQASQIAMGDYNQTIDFMGDFSDAFNTMINQLRERETRLKGMHERMMNAFDSMYDLVVITTSEGELLFCNQAARKTIYTRKRRRKDTVHSTLFDGIRASVQKGEGETEFCDENEGKWYLIKTSRMQWGEDENAFINSCTDITLRRNRENELKQAIDTDFLTGVLSRNAGLRRLDKELADLKEGESICVGLIDIDSLKHINDNFGHTEGDRAIVALARILRKTLRTTDVVCRLSGDEFFVAMKNCDEDMVASILARANALVDRYNQTQNAGYLLGFSGGFYIANCGDESTHAISMADEQMYKVKNEKHSLRENLSELGAG